MANCIINRTQDLSGKQDKLVSGTNIKTINSTSLLGSGNVAVAPTSHASSATTYGLGTTSNYGHVKLADNLTTSATTNGVALDAYQGKLLNDKISNKVNKAGDTMTGDLTLSGKSLVINSSANSQTVAIIDSRIDSDVKPTANVFTGGTSIRDKNNKYVASFAAANYVSDGAQGANIDGTRNIGGTNKYNSLRLLVDMDGNPIVSVVGGSGANDAAEAWRKMIKFSNYITSPNLDNYSYNTMAYTTGTGTNFPSGVSTAGQLIVISNANNGYPKQFYSPYNSNKLFTRCNNGTAWSSWVRFDNNVVKGETLTCSGVYLCAGYTTASQVRFTIPCSNIFESTPKNVTLPNITVYSHNGVLLDKQSSTTVTDVSYSNGSLYVRVNHGLSTSPGTIGVSVLLTNGYTVVSN